MRSDGLYARFQPDEFNRLDQKTMTGSSSLSKKNSIFTVIPGVGPKSAAEFEAVGLETLDDLKECDPERLYKSICVLFGGVVDRCMLYVCRCAVYFASKPSEEHDPELLKWWNWKEPDWNPKKNKTKTQASRRKTSSKPEKKTCRQEVAAEERNDAPAKPDSDQADEVTPAQSKNGELDAAER